jgi:hypothetical protein
VILLCKKKSVIAKSSKVKTGSSLAESSKQGYSSKSVVLQAAAAVAVAVVVVKFIIQEYNYN